MSDTVIGGDVVGTRATDGSNRVTPVGSTARGVVEWWPFSEPW